MTRKTSLRVPALALALILAMVASSTPLMAQNPAQPNFRVQPDSASMAGAMANMAPMMQQMMTAQLTATLQFYAKPETADLMAQIAHNYYLALIRQGFTAEQALVIVAASKPAAPPSPR
jgi:hypothetical protein